MQDFSQVKVGDVLCLVFNVYDFLDVTNFRPSLPFCANTVYAKVKAIVVCEDEHQFSLDLSGVCFYSPGTNCFRCTDSMVFIPRTDHNLLTGIVFRDLEKFSAFWSFDVIHASVS